MKRLDQLCDPINEQCDPSASGTSVYVGLEHIDSGAFHLTRHGSPADVRSAKSRFRKGDVLYGKLRPYLDKAVLTDRDGICSTDILVFRPKPDVCGAYLLSLIHSSDFLEQAVSTAHGLNHPRTSWSSLSSFVWDIPEEGKQKKIATVLSKVQRAIRVEDKLLSATRELKQSALRQLFTRGLRAETQKETEIGSVPVSWVDNNLGSLAEIAYGAQAAVANATDPAIGTPIFTNINISNDGKIDLSTLRYFKIPERHRDRLMLQRGDVLFNWRSGSAEHVGKTALFELDGEFTYSSFILRFRVFKDVTAEYLYYYLNYIKSNGFFVNQRNVSSINSVYNASLAATIPVHFPADQAVQKELVAVLRVIDRKIAVIERKRAALQELFKTLLHELMTGQISVDKLDIDTSEVEVIN